ncbi:phosphorylase [Thermodesulfobium sp. 4217-1]|uniref:phosphorylase n=1 Tax=Thermodesulfobium sp. 4217-1 TaxID=3120013 RepID=UPI0032219F5B
MKKKSIWGIILLAILFSTTFSSLALAQSNYLQQFSPKVIILTAFLPEYNAWQDENFNKTIEVSGLIKPLSCDNRDVCIVMTGEGEMNAAISVTSIIKDKSLNISKTIFIRSGISGGVDEPSSSYGSVYINSWVISWSFGHHYLNDQKKLDWIQPGCSNYALPGHCNEYTQNLYENLAYKIDDGLLNIAKESTKNLQLENSSKAVKLDSEFGLPTTPTIKTGAVVAGDDYWIGFENEAIAKKITALYSNKAANYTDTAMEDIGDIAALSKFGLENHYLSIRSVSDIDVPEPGKTDEEAWKISNPHEIHLAIKNVVLVTKRIVDELVK